MALTKIGSIGINTGIQLAGVTTTTTLKVGTGVTIVSDGDGYYTGVVTATSFSGNGANLTGIDSTKIETGNTKVETIDTGSDGHVKITTEGTERGRFDATGLFTMNGKASLGKTATGVPFAIGDSGTSGDRVLHFKRAATTNDINIQSINSGTGASSLLLNSEGGKVGIGEDSPQRELHITTASNCGLRLEGGSSSTCQVLFTPAGGTEHKGRIGYYHGDDHMDFYTAANERMRIDSSGRLLLTTSSNTSPIGWGNKLQVAGTDASAGVSIRRDENGTGGALLVFGKSRGSLNGNTVVQSGDQLGGMYFAGADGTDVNSVAAQISVEVDGTPGSNDMPGRILFKTSADGSASPAERLRIASDGYIYVAGSGGTIDTDRLPNGHTINIAGTSSADGVSIIRYSANYGAYGLNIGKSNNNTLGTNTLVTDGEELGHISFYGADGTDFHAAARITGRVDGTPSGATDMPGALSFRTTPDGSENPAERMLIGSSGDVWFDRSVDGAHTVYIRNMSTTSTSSAATTNIIDFKFNRSGGGVNLSAAKIVVGKEQEWVGAAANQDGYIAWHTALNESPAEKMRLSSGGNLMVGTTTGAVSSTDQGVSLNGDAAIVSRRDGVMHYFKSIATGGYSGIIIQSANTQVGSMTFNSGGTAWNTTSDYRLKENEVAISDGITRLKTLKPYRFNFKNNPSLTLDGFYAHEVTAVPEAITGTKDAVATAEDIEKDSSLSIGDPIYQQIDQSKLVPLLTAALQEAITKIETLETKVAALESS